MEQEPLFTPSPFLEIRDPQLNVKEIMRDLESKIPLSPSNEIDWERVSQMQFQPESPEGFRKFDPAGTAHLFEKGIAPPKFTNPKLWFIKGPLKFLFNRFIEFYSLVDKKLSENRIRAFFSVLHELIRIGKRVQRLETRFEGFYKDYLLHSDRNRQANLNFGWATNQYFDDSGLTQDWNLVLDDLKASGKTLVLFPEWGEILKQLTFQTIPFLSITNQPSEHDFILKKISSNIQLVESLFPLEKNVSQKMNVILFLPLNRFPSHHLETIFAELSRWMQQNHHLYFSVQSEPDAKNRPFADVHVSKIDLKLLSGYLSGFGFSKERDLSVSDNLKVIKYTKIS